MDVVADTGAIGGGVIVAEHLQLRQFSHRDLGDEGHQIVRDAVRVLADPSAGVRADRVEVAQQGDVPARVRPVQIAQDFLNHQFCPPIGVGRRERHIFGDRHLGGVAVHGRRRTEHQVPDAVRLHGLAQHQRPGDVVVVVAERDRHRLAHCLEPGEVDHRLDRRAGERDVQPCAIQQINPMEDQRPARELLDPMQRLLLAVAQVVDDDDLMAGA